MEDNWISWLLKLPHRVWVLLLALAVVLVIGQALLSGDQLISHPSTDIANQFFASRVFGFGEIARGEFPLWNPFTYGGAPYLGQFQSALLYPLNLLFLILPIGQALNWSIALHIFICGLGVYAWTACKQICRPAAFLAAVAVVCGGTLFLRSYAGHLSNLCAMAWVPFLFLCIDRWLAERHGKWVLLASLVVALQITAGHPQYVYYTAIAAALYVLVSGAGLSRPFLAISGFLCIYILATLIGAAQLWPGLRLAAETSRSGGVDYAFASMFSLPPENLLTFVAPWFFGDMRSTPYWGRCYLWEMEAYMGIGVLLLAIFGAAGLRKGALWRPLILFAIFLLLALGRHTLLYSGMFQAVPLFSLFRGTSKFLFFATLFVALFAAHGFDRLLKGHRPALGWGMASVVVAVFLIICSLVLASGGSPSEGWWQWGWNKIAQSGESYLPQEVIISISAMAAAKQAAAHSLLIAGVILALFGAGMILVRSWREVIWLIGIGAIVEVAVFAHNSLTTFSARDLFYPEIKEITKQLPPDSRILNLFNSDISLLLRTENIWGYDPSVLKRYAQLLAHSQGSNPDQITQYIVFNRPSKILELLRCRKTFQPSDQGVAHLDLKSDFPRFFLVGTAIVATGRDAVFEAIDRADLHKEVVLEETPHPVPAGSAPQGSVTVLKQSNHRWLLKVETDRPAILVNTDAWSADWRAKALPKSVQQKYEVLPADYAIRAIPLSAGQHLLELVYWPRGWGIAIAVSVVSLLVVLSFLSAPFIVRSS